MIDECSDIRGTGLRSRARILVRAKMQVFATPMSGDRLSYDFLKSAYLLTLQLNAYENMGHGGRVTNGMTILHRK